MYASSSSSMSDHPFLPSRLNKRGAGKWTNRSDLTTFQPDFLKKGYLIRQVSQPSLRRKKLVMYHRIKIKPLYGELNV
jgi:hypothetical protein